MAELEKVIDELVEHIENALSVDSDYVDCVRTDLLQTAVALLKEQEPRVITIDEFRQYSGETMWLETKNNELQQLTMEGIAIVLMEAEITRWDGCGSYWRCWNKRPTDEQRREVEWND